MKNLFSGATLVVLLSLTMSLAFSNQVQAQENNGVDVEIIKGADFYWFRFGCEGYKEEYHAEKSTEVWKDGEIHSSTYIFTLPPGHCAIPKKAKKIQYNPWLTALFTPSGKIILKENYNTY